MAGVKSKPTFLILPLRLPPTEAGRVIGRFVTDINNPLANSAPQDPLSILGDKIVETSETDAKSTLSSTADRSVRPFLEGLLSFKVGVSASSESTIESSLIKTYRLQDYWAAFDVLVKTASVYDAIAGPTGLLARNSGRLYLVIGIKTCRDGKLTTTVTKGREYSALVSVPLAAAFSGLPIKVNPGIELNLSKSATTGKEATTLGEYIFAVEYLKVEQRSIFGYSADRVIKPGKQAMPFEWGNATYGNRDKDEVDAEDEDEDSEDAVEATVTTVAEEHIEKEAFDLHPINYELELSQSGVDIKGLL